MRRMPRRRGTGDRGRIARSDIERSHHLPLRHSVRRQQVPLEPQQTHAPDLLRHSEKDTWHRGNYKTNSNSIAAYDESGAQIGILFQTASPFDTPRLMTALVAWVNQERETARQHPLLIIALCVVVFLEIHPFEDGNGRLSRVLTMLLLLQAGYA